MLASSVRLQQCTPRAGPVHGPSQETPFANYSCCICLPRWRNEVPAETSLMLTWCRFGPASGPAPRGSDPAQARAWPRAALHAQQNLNSDKMRSAGGRAWRGLRASAVRLVPKTLGSVRGGRTLAAAAGVQGARWYRDRQPNSRLATDLGSGYSRTREVRSNYCIDNTRIFSVGMSYGGIMSNTVGCALGDDFRAIAPMSGLGPRAGCSGQVAAWISHGNEDTVVRYSGGEDSRDHWVEANHCQTSSNAGRQRRLRRLRRMR